MMFFCTRSVYMWWPAKDVFAAGIIEADLRPIYVGQNFVVKWRGLEKNKFACTMHGSMILPIKSRSTLENRSFFISSSIISFCKFSGKPVFLKRRTPEQIALAQADDPVIGSMRDPELDEKRWITKILFLTIVRQNSLQNHFFLSEASPKMLILYQVAPAPNGWSASVCALIWVVSPSPIRVRQIWYFTTFSTHSA